MFFNERLKPLLSRSLRHQTLAKKYTGSRISANFHQKIRPSKNSGYFLLMNKILFLSLIFNLNTSFAISQSATEPDDVFRLEKEWARGNDYDESADFNLGIFSLALPNSTCTGSLISKEGHLLLAKHCIEEAVSLSQDVGQRLASPLLTTPDFFFSLKSLSKFDAYIYNNNNIGQNLEVPVKVDRSIYYAKIIATGAGNLSPRFSDSLENPQPETLKDYIKYTEEGFSLGGDFAIIKIPELRGKSCYRLSSQKVLPSTKLHSVGFPCWKEESKDWPQVRWTNMSQLFAKGEMMGRLYIPKGSIISKLEIEKCNSGSPLLNAANEIVGVIHSGYTEDTDDTSRVVSLSVKRILELTPPEISKKIQKLNQACKM
jgi:hypothetical protein